MSAIAPAQRAGARRLSAMGSKQKCLPQAKQMAEYWRIVLTCVQSRLECAEREDGRWQCHDCGP